MWSSYHQKIQIGRYRLVVYFQGILWLFYRSNIRILHNMTTLGLSHTRENKVGLTLTSSSACAWVVIAWHKTKTNHAWCVWLFFHITPILA